MFEETGVGSASLCVAYFQYPPTPPFLAIEKYAALYHSFSVGIQYEAPEIFVALVPLMA